MANIWSDNETKLLITLSITFLLRRFKRKKENQRKTFFQKCLCMTSSIVHNSLLGTPPTYSGWYVLVIVCAPLLFVLIEAPLSIWRDKVVVDLTTFTRCHLLSHKLSLPCGFQTTVISTSPLNARAMIQKKKKDSGKLVIDNKLTTHNKLLTTID